MSGRGCRAWRGIRCPSLWCRRAATGEFNAVAFGLLCPFLLTLSLMSVAVQNMPRVPSDARQSQGAVPAVQDQIRTRSLAWMLLVWLTTV